MKTIVHVDLDDVERRYLASLIDGRETKRLATRKDVTTLVDQIVAQVLREATNTVEAEHLEPPQKPYNSSRHKPARPDDASYMRGWNAVGAALLRR